MTNSQGRHSSQGDVVCELPKSPGRSVKSQTAGLEITSLGATLPPSYTIETAWIITLYLYTGLEDICFQYLTLPNDTRGVVVSSCGIAEDTTVESIQRRLQLRQQQEASVEENKNRYHYNTSLVMQKAQGTLHDESSQLHLPEGIDVALHVIEVEYQLCYRQSFMSNLEAKKLMLTFRHVLQLIMEKTANTISDITITSEDKAEIMSWNSGKLAQIDPNWVIHQEFARSAAKYAQKEAICSWDGSMSYEDVKTVSTGLAKHLRHRGVKEGSRVLYCFRKSRWVVISVLAILKAGATCVPLDPKHPKDRVCQIIRKTGAAHVLVGSEDIADLLSSYDEEICVVDSRKSWNIPGDAEIVDDPVILPGSPAVCLFTSGSTGTPKGIVLAHGQLCLAMKAVKECFGVDENTRVLQFSSYTFDASVAEILVSMLHGATLCIPSEEERIDDLQGYILRTRANWTLLTPTVARQLEPGVVQESLKTVVLIGEKVQDSDIKPWKNTGVRLLNSYGPSENTMIVTSTMTQEGFSSNVGHAVHTRTWIVDMDKRRVLPVGAVGELVIESNQLALGYLDEPEKTKASFLEEIDFITNMSSESGGVGTKRRFYRTGDLIRYGADGSLVYVGRADGQVKHGGQRVELTEIESQIQLHPRTPAAIVLLPTSGPLAKRLTAITKTDGSSTTSCPAFNFSSSDHEMVAEVTSSINQKLPSYMIPSMWLSIDQFPTTMTGKLDRKILLSLLTTMSSEAYDDLLMQGDEKEIETNDLSENQALLRDVCSQVLNIPSTKISLSKSFIGIGGDSITAMQVAFSMRQKSKKTITVKSLLSSSTILDAADFITSTSPLASSDMGTVEPWKRYSLSPIQQLFFKVAKTPDTWNHFHQSKLMKLQEHREPRQVEESILSVIDRHPILRAMFEKSPEEISWMQYIVPADQSRVKLEIVDGISSPKDRERAMMRARHEIDIVEGPLVRAQLFPATADSPDALLFIVVHHLVMDLVSWRNILQELETSLKTNDVSAAENAEFDELIPFPVWANLQSEATRDIQPAQTIPFSSTLPEQNFGFWGLDPMENIHADVRETRVTLDTFTSARLLDQCHEALNTEPVDVLLAAVILSFRRSFPDRKIPAIFTEGHGREPWDDDLDVSRTVGWFSIAYPVHVVDMNAGDIVDVVRRVKDYRRRISNNGFDYFSSMYFNKDGKQSLGNQLPAEVVFNFEGRYQALEKEDSVLKPQEWHAGEAIADASPNLVRFSLFELAAAVFDDKMHLTCAWNAKTRHQERIAVWLTSLFPAAVGEISSILTYSSPRQLTITDFSLLQLENYEDVETLTATALTVPGISSIDDIEDILPGSPMQNSLALSQSKAEDGAYEVEAIWEVNNFVSGKDRINIELLTAAWKETVSRHSMLRTVLLEATNASTNMIQQVVLKSFNPDCVILNAEDDGKALKLLEEYPQYREEGLFADKKPPHRLLICQTHNKTLIKLQMNHIIFDGMSTSPLLRDLSASYETLVTSQGKHSGGRLRTTIYADYLRYILDSTRRADSLAYWKEYLNGASLCYFPTLVNSSLTPASHNKQKMEQRGRSPVHINISTAEIQALLERLEITLPVLFQMIWALLLKTYTGEAQSVFGYLASGRDAPVDGIEGGVGPFISILVCYVDFMRDSHKGINEIMKSIQRATADSITHQGPSLAEIQNTIGLPGSARLFNSGVTVLPRWTTQMQARENWALLFEEVSLKDPTEFDLSLIVETGDEVDDTISLHLDYLESAVSAEHAINIANTINSIITKLLHVPSVSVEDLTSVSQKDWEKIKSWNQTLIEPVEDCMHTIFSRRTREHPEREAIYSWDGSMTYKEVDELSDVLAKDLIASYGVQVEQMIPLCFEKSLWTVVAMLAVLKAGGCFVLLDPAQPEARLRLIVKEVEASIMLCSTRSLSLGAFAVKTGEEALDVTLMEVDRSSLSQLQAKQMEQSYPRVSLDEVAVGPDNAMYVVFTSGTTGTPKGAIATHKALVTGLHEQAGVCGMLDLGSNVRSLQFASYAFDASLGDMLTTMQAGGCICIPKDEDRGPADITTFLSRSRATYAGITSSFASLLNPSAIPTLRALVVGGEPLTASLIDSWSDRVSLTNMYGPTEGTVGCIANTHITKSTSASNIGKGYRTATWVVDPNDHNILQPIGAIGELLIEGPILCRGYLKRPEQTAKAFINSPTWLQSLRPDSRLYKTGDLVRYDADGSIICIGRKDTQIKINGQRVEVGEIEHALTSCLSISKEGPVVVDLLKRSKHREPDLLVAFVCIEKSGADEGEQLIARSSHAKSQVQAIVERFQHPHSAVSSLPQYMIPQAYIPIIKLPMTQSRKVDRRLLQQVCADLSRNELLSISSDGALSTVGTKATTNLATQAEIKLAAMWEKVLNIKGIGRSSNFFRLGGNSMSSLQLRAEARRCGLSLSVADIFGNPVLMEMAKLLPVDNFLSVPGTTGGADISISVSPSDTPTPSILTPSGSHSPVSSRSSVSDTTPSTYLEQESVKPFSLLGLEGESLSTEIEGVAQSCQVSAQEIEDVFPSTPMQEALMVLSSNNESKGAFSMYLSFKLSKGFDKRKLQAAWEETTAIHSILRSRIVTHGGRSYVVITKPAVPVQERTVSSFDQYLKEQEENHFNHGSPLCRLAIVNDGQDGQTYFFLGAHHAIYDGWSIELIFKTFFQLWEGREAVHRGPQFQTFARELQLMDKHEAEEYWRGAFQNPDDEGFDFPIYPQSHKPVAKCIHNQEDLSFNSDAAPEMGVTMTALFQAAWAVTLAQYTASQSVTFGVTLQGRDFPMEDIEQVAGPLIVTIPRQLHLDPGQSIGAFVRSAHDVNVASLRYQHVGLDQIQRAGPMAKQACSFSSLLVVKTKDGNGLEESLRSIGMDPVETRGMNGGPYPLILECSAGKTSLDLQIWYDPDCIDEPMVARVAQQFHHNLGFICHTSSTSHALGSLELSAALSAVVPSHIYKVIEWTDQTRSKRDPATVPKVHEMVQAHARRNPSDLAITGHDAIAGLTYAEIDSYSDSLALKIKSLNLTTKERPFVALCLENSAAAPLCMLAINKVGAAFMPLNPQQPQARLLDLAERAEAKLVLVSPSYASMFDNTSSHVMEVDMEILQQIHRERQQQSMEDAITSAKQLAVTGSNDDPAYLLFTSGTSGKPKGVVVEHGAWACQMMALAETFKFNRDTRILQFMNYNFDLCLLDIYIPWISGSCVCVPSYEQKMNDLEGYLITNKINTLNVTPTMSRTLNPAKLPQIRLIALGGEPLTQPDVDLWQNGTRRVINGYGPSETCVLVTAREIENVTKLEDRLKTASNIGHGIGAVGWVVKPSKKSALVPIGAVGELLIEGPSLAQGYYKDPERTAASFPSDILEALRGQRLKKQDRVYCTGDFVRLASDGSLEYMGRRDGQIKLRGQRIDVGEIEHHINRLLSEKNVDFRSSSVQLFKPQAGENIAPFLGAFLVMEDVGFTKLVNEVRCQPLLPAEVDQTCDGESKSAKLSALIKDAQRSLRGILPSYMIPSTFIAVERLPLSMTGKIDGGFLQTCLRELFTEALHAKPTDASNENIQLTSNETLLRGWWSSILGLEASIITPNSDFFAIGGNSISAMRLVGMARSTEYVLEYKHIFGNPVLSDMALCLAVNTWDEGEDTSEIDHEEHSVQTDQIQMVTNTAQSEDTVVCSLEKTQLCTDYQKAYINGANMYPNAHSHQMIFSLDESMSLSRLEDAFNSCADWFPTLCTRIVPDPADSKSLVQVVSPKGSKITWRTILQKEDEDLQNAIEEDKINPPGANGQPLNRVSIVTQSSKSTRVLIWHLNHAAYDGWSFDLMLQHIKMAYQDLNWRPASTALPFSKFVKEASQAFNKSRTFWETYLEGVEPSKFLFNYESVKQPLQNRVTTLQTKFSFKKPRGTTTGNIVLAAWVLVLAKLTGRRDIVVAHLLNGRMMSLAGIETCPGPTIVRVPLRIRLPAEPEPLPSFQTVLSTVSSELLNVLPHAQGGLSAIENLIPANGDASAPINAGTLMGRLPLDLAVNMGAELDFQAGANIGMQQMDMRPATPGIPGGLEIYTRIMSESKTDGGGETIGLEMEFLWDDRAARDKDIEQLAAT